jgi:homoserine kinase
MQEVRVFAPASIANLAVGFDIMGLCLEKPGDEIIARFSDQPGLRIVKMTGSAGKIPHEPEKNTAGVAALRLLEHLGQTNRGIELEIHKKMPSGSGLGSSAASAVGAAVAVSELLQTGLSKLDLLYFACLGEQLASGSFHADNVAPSLLGGIVFIRDNATLDVHSLPVPEGLCIAVVYPHIEVLTKEARAILRPDVPLKDHIRQSANLAGFMTGLHTGDLTLLGRSLQDLVIEPQRAQLIPGFYDVKTAAMQAGALGSSISGAGPSVFAFCPSAETAENAGSAMQRAFSRHQIDSTIYVSAIQPGGAIVI